MKYSYDSYFSVNFKLPIILCIAATVFFATQLLPKILVLIHTRKVTMSAIPQLLLPMALVIWFLVIGGGPLWRGGYHLLYEKESDAVSVTGAVSRISAISSMYGMKYRTDKGTSFGYEITVNDVSYIIMDSAGIEKGDIVELSVLPRSNLILEVQSINQNCDDPKS